MSIPSYRLHLIIHSLSKNYLEDCQCHFLGDAIRVFGSRFRTRMFVSNFRV